MDAKTKILIDKRLAELNCLGIEPKLYYNVCKLLDRHVCTVIKDGRFYTFPNKDNNLTLTNEKYVKAEDIHMLISTVYGLNNHMIHMILMEWQREKIIYNNMSQSVVKYWDYLSLPLYSKETDETKYNF